MKNLTLILTVALLILSSCQKPEEKPIGEESSNEISTTDEISKQTPEKGKEVLPEDEEGSELFESEAETLPTKEEALALYGASVIDADQHDYSYIPLIDGEISHRFASVGEIKNEFNSGMKPILDENYKLVYVDEEGNRVIETGLEDKEYLMPDYSMLPGGPTCDFSDGIAFLGDGQYMDTDGNIFYIKNGSGMYKCGLVMVYEYDENGRPLYGYADINGEIKIPCKYKKARDFTEEGFALVFGEDMCYDKEIFFEEYGFEPTPYSGYINTRGEEVIPLEYYCCPGSVKNYAYPEPCIGGGIIELYKEGYTYYFNYDGEIVGKKPEKYQVSYQENGRKKYMSINLGMYYDSLKAAD